MDVAVAALVAATRVWLVRDNDACLGAGDVGRGGVFAGSGVVASDASTARVLCCDLLRTRLIVSGANTEIAAGIVAARVAVEANVAVAARVAVSSA
mmetsp:Transcript_75537/g.122728  ORF Transcript_75537/g.122728 Transcript_75537/m.122728 type:complete len:96 (-) Transcript_75537:52-339(-)